METVFRNQEHLKDIRVGKDLKKSINGVEALIFAVPHSEYLDLNPDDIVSWAGAPIAVIDAFGMLSDEKNQTIF